MNFGVSETPLWALDEGCEHHPLWNGPTNRTACSSWGSRTLQKLLRRWGSLSYGGSSSSATNAPVIQVQRASHQPTLNFPPTDLHLCLDFTIWTHRWAWVANPGRLLLITWEESYRQYNCHGTKCGPSNVMEWHWLLRFVCDYYFSKRYIFNRYVFISY